MYLQQYLNRLSIVISTSKDLKNEYLTILYYDTFLNLCVYFYRVESISSKLEPSSFNASSWYSSNTEPYYAQLDSEDNGYWRPAKSSETEYLQMDLGQAETIYGIEVTGSPTHDEYVTSYLVAHSLDGVGFSFVSYNGQPKVLSICLLVVQ